MTMRFGAQLWSQQTDWPGWRDAALAAEAAGWDSVWTWDHLLAIFGPWEQPIFEGWAVLAAIAPISFAAFGCARLRAASLMRLNRDGSPSRLLTVSTSQTSSSFVSSSTTAAPALSSACAFTRW